MLAQSTGTKWASSLGVVVHDSGDFFFAGRDSPVMRTLASVLAMRAIVARRLLSCGLVPKHAGNDCMPS